MLKKNIPMDENKNIPLEEQGKMPQEEEVRENIITEFGFDEDIDSDRIDKLVEKEMENSKKLSDAIGQKIKHRDRVKELEDKLEKPPVKEEVKIDDDFDKKLDEKLNERLEKKALDELDYSDELKEEIENLSKLKKVSIKQVLRDPYIVSRVEAFEKENETEEASISRSKKSRGKKTFSMDAAPDSDMSTVEGRKEWADYKDEMVKAGY